MTITPQLIQDKIREITSPGQFFEMEERVVGGRALRAYKHAPATLVDVLQAARGHGDLDFIVYEGRRLSFDRFFAEADALAATLQRDHGIGKGDRVAIAMRNCPEWSVAFTAAALAGAIVVPVNSWGKMEELRFALTDCGARCLICDEPRYGLLAGVHEALDIDVLVAGAGADFRPGARVHAFEGALARGQGGGPARCRRPAPRIPA